jgi:hypothetical protein
MGELLALFSFADGSRFGFCHILFWLHFALFLFRCRALGWWSRQVVTGHVQAQEVG